MTRPESRPVAGAPQTSGDRHALAGGRLTIDLDALVGNWRALRDRLHGASCGAAVKGDAYGIGLESAATALSEAGCETFFVALPDEALRLRAALPDATIHVLNGLFPGAAQDYAAANLIPVLGSMAEIDEWAAFCAAHGRRLPATIHIDTGMNRLGLRLDEARALAADTDTLASFELVLLISHLTCAGDAAHPLNALQLDRFRETTALFPGVPRSLANSAGIFLGPEYHFDIARPGIALYGGEAVDNTPNPMRPVVTLETRILMLRDADAGESVGYGAAEVLEHPARLAILATGYADGYHRLAGRGGDTPSAQAWIAGHFVPLVGRVSMDLIVVDVTGVPAHLCERGAWVELFGPHVSVDSVAACAQTIGYELLTALGGRYTRSYVPVQQSGHP